MAFVFVSKVKLVTNDAHAAVINKPYRAAHAHAAVINKPYRAAHAHAAVINKPYRAAVE